MAALAAGPWLAGWLARPLHREAQELAALAAQLERQREAGIRLAVADERARLARELHDAVAHSVSAMVVQAAAAEAVMTHSPAEASGSLRACRRWGARRSRSCARMLRILRDRRAACRSPRRRARARPPPAPAVVGAPRRRAGARLFAVVEWVALTQFAGPLRLPGVLLMATATLPLALQQQFPLSVLVTSAVAIALYQRHLDPVLMSPSWRSPG